MENRNLQWSKRAKVPLILIFSVNTNHESVAYRSFSPSEFEARGARKVRVSFSEQTESVLLVSALPLMVRECQLARPSNCGEFLRAFVTAFTWKHGVAHQGNDLGYGKNTKDWIIRSQVLRALHRVYGCRSTTIWRSVPF